MIEYHLVALVDDLKILYLGRDLLHNIVQIHNIHYYKTRLLQLGFLTPTSEKIQTLLTWKTTSRSGQAVKCGHSYDEQDVPSRGSVC